MHKNYYSVANCFSKIPPDISENVENFPEFQNYYLFILRILKEPQMMFCVTHPGNAGLVA
jgi:hypothetical protein